MKTLELFDLTGKVAVVTGGSIGLGAQIAEALSEVGANLVIAARKVERCAALCQELEKNGIKALPAACDVSNPEDCKNLIDLTVKEFGTIDILVNNAGFTWGADVLDYPMDKWQKVFDVNVTGLFNLSVLAAKVMKEKGGGKIINIASISGFYGDPPGGKSTPAYNASKGAVITLTKELAVKFAQYGICVNSIAPGFFPTHMSEGVLEKEKVRNYLLSKIPLNRFGNNDDLKGAVVLLSSAASDYITGHCLIVDGGKMAAR
ncbi:MAG: glucose 1-dehydrogenase [Syntrophomonadaceae bacterium]|jgi:NAD(P)-dependent dehydrogenase (short-subunit alcohol dehydrogenase family)